MSWMAVETARFLFAIRVDALCRKHRASVTSWWRTPARNLKVGGVHGSRHEIGLAVDVVYDRDPPPVAELEELGFHVLREKDHDHLELAGQLKLDVAGALRIDPWQ